MVLKILFTHKFCLGFANHVCQTNKLKTVHTLQCTLYTVHYVQHRPELSTLETSQGGGHMGELRMWLFSRLCWMYWGCTHHILNWYLSWSQEWGCCSHHLQSQMAFQRWTGCGHSYCSCTWGYISRWVLQVWFLNLLPSAYLVPGLKTSHQPQMSSTWTLSPMLCTGEPSLTCLSKPYVFIWHNCYMQAYKLNKGVYMFKEVKTNIP